MGKIKVALAFSGGLDTSVCLKLLQEKYNADVITVTVDVGQGSEKLKAAAERAEMLGAIKHYSIDAREEFIEGYVFKSIKANGNYEGYPLSTALARYPTASELARVALEEGADAAAHGCTGKGNDQFRFDMTISIKAPKLRIIAPIRELNLDRKWEINYAREHGVPFEGKPYSIDENLWGRSIEGGILEDPGQPPPEDIYKLTSSLAEAATEPRTVKIGFEAGVPVSLDGERKSGVELISELNGLAGRYSIGRIDMIEDRILGLKAREIYEAPAATVLLQAHEALERLVLTRDDLTFKSLVDEKWAEMVYRGLWFDPLREHLDAFIDSTQKRVEGEIETVLCRGYSKVTGRKSPYSIYDKELVSFETFGFDQSVVGPLLKFHGLQGRVAKERLRE